MSQASKRRRRVPRYCHHKARNLARVTIDGKDHYLGTYNSPESKELYRQLIAEWLDRQQEKQQQVDAEIRICQLMARFVQTCQGYFRKSRKLTREYGCISEALRVLREDFELERVDRFGPKALKTQPSRWLLITGRELGGFARDTLREQFRWTAWNLA